MKKPPYNPMHLKQEIGNKRIGINRLHVAIQLEKENEDQAVKAIEQQIKDLNTMKQNALNNIKAFTSAIAREEKEIEEYKAMIEDHKKYRDLVASNK